MTVGFALLWSKILLSSLWIKGSKETRLLWITLLAMKDSKGQVHCSVPGLANMAKITEDECRNSLRELMMKDPDDTSGVNEGRRIRSILGGWEIVNHDLYRFSTEAKREFWKQQKNEQRSKTYKIKSGPGSRREQQYVTEVESGQALQEVPPQPAPVQEALTTPGSES